MVLHFEATLAPPPMPLEFPHEPLIHRAARRGDVRGLERLVGEGADIDQRADVEHDSPALQGVTPLMVAARSVDGATTRAMRWLVERGADVSAKSRAGLTAAWYAAGHGARPWYDRRAVTADHVERLRYLLDLGADPDGRDQDGRWTSLLDEAIDAGDPARVRLLIERGASVDPIRHLGCAVGSGVSACVQVLLDAGADPNGRDSYGDSIIVCRCRSAEVSQVLLAAGADPAGRVGGEDDALEGVLDGLDGLDVEDGVSLLEGFRAAQVLVDAGLAVDHADGDGLTRLGRRAGQFDDESVELLLILGADVRARFPGGHTPLHWACWHGDYDDSYERVNRSCERVIGLLVGAGADIEARNDDGRTPLHEAAWGDRGNATAVRTLLRLGAVPDALDANGETPLAGAALAGADECVRLLLNAGADPLRKNREGQSALDHARTFLSYGYEWDEREAKRTVAMLERVAVQRGGDNAAE